MASGSILVASFAVEAKEPAKLTRVGWLATVPQPDMQTEFRRAMRGLGHVEDSTYVIDERYADAGDKLPAAAAELIGLNPDVIVAESAVAVRAAKQATTDIPIVFVTGDPVQFGFAQSLARPGGNLTGVANLSLELVPKRLELLKAVLPRMRRLATLQAHPVVDPARMSQTVERAARANGVEALPVIFVSRVADLDAAFAKASRGQADAMLVAANPFSGPRRRDRPVMKRHTFTAAPTVPEQSVRGGAHEVDLVALLIHRGGKPPRRRRHGVAGSARSGSSPASPTGSADGSDILPAG